MPVNIIATNCPAPVLPGNTVYRSALYSGASTPPTSQSYAPGIALVSAKLNQNAGASDINTRYGAGGYGVGAGLVVSAGTGITVEVSAGQAIIDGLVDHATTQTVVVPAASARAWIWLMANGTFTVQNNTTTKPAGNCCLVGSCVTDGSGVTSVDSSGVLYWQGGLLWRDTADPGKPGDTPNAALRLFSKTLGGLYFWDGTAHRRLSEGGYLAKSVAGSSNVTLSAVEASNNVLELTGTLTGNIDVIFPASPGAQWTVFNNTTGAFTLTAKQSGQTGFAITQGKRAIGYSDGTDIRKVIESP